MKEKLNKIVNYYGIEHQLKKLSEEIYELQEAILKGDIDHIEEEYADTCVLLQQIKQTCELNDDKIVKIMEKKVDRQINRIERESEIQKSMQCLKDYSSKTIANDYTKAINEILGYIEDKK